MDERIRKVLNHIEDHLGQKLDLAELSSIACLSPSQFHRVFKQATNRTPFRFVEELKINKAYQLIMQEDLMVHEMTELLGYNDYETFSRAFKKYFQFSPDDLKAIVNSLKKDLVVDGNQELLIATLDDAQDQGALLEHLKQFMADRNVSVEDLKDAKIYKITNKTNSKEPQKLIKNKYSLTTENKLWESLINPK